MFHTTRLFGEVRTGPLTTVNRTQAEINSLCYSLHETGTALAHLSVMGTTTIVKRSR